MKTPRRIRSGNKKVSFDWDQSEFQKNADKLIKQIPEQIQNILIEVAPDFSNAAAKYTPPNIGRQSIQKKYYERTVLVLARLIHGGYKTHKATEEDKNAFKNGKIYKVLNTKAGSKKRRSICLL